MQSIQSTTTWFTFFGVCLVVFSLFTTSYFVSRKILIDNFDADFMLEFKNIASSAKVWPSGEFYVDIEFDVATQFNTGGTRIFQVWNETGDEIIDQSPMLEDQNRHLPYPTNNALRKPLFFDFTDHFPGRAIFQVIDTQWGWIEERPYLKVDEETKSRVVQLLVIRERTSLDKSLELLRNWMLITGAVLPLLTFLIVRIAIYKGLQPLRELTSQVNIIRSSDEKIDPLKIWPSEISPVIKTLNALLQRLDITLIRERRFNADVAHELRSPLSELRLATDIALRAHNRPERLLTAVNHANDLSHSMAELVNSMLFLARFQSGKSQPEMKPFDLSRVFDEHYRQIRNVARNRDLIVIIQKPDTLCFNSNSGLVSRIISILFNNAVAYAPSGSIVKFLLSRTVNGFMLQTVNFAPDIETDDLDKLYHPFWSKGAAREQRDHYGLGLAIVKEAAACLNLEIRTSLSKEHALHLSVQSLNLHESSE